MPQYKINFTTQDPWNKLKDSKIPIYFKSVLMYKSPAYRGVLSERFKLQRIEFLRVIGNDTFVSVCPSMNHLFSFLDYYHGLVMKTITLVENFLNVVNNYNAVLKRNES